MSREGMKVALAHGASLPTFPDIERAEKALFALRDERLKALVNAYPELTFSPESLKTVEAMYFVQHKPDALDIGFYFGEVLCRNAGFSWKVGPNDFVQNRYEIGVGRGLLSIMITNGWQPREQGNKLKQSLWREYRKYVL